MCQAWWCCYGCGAELPQSKGTPKPKVEEYDQTVKLCVVAVERCTRPPKGAAPEHQQRRPTRLGMVGHVMFPPKHDAQGHRTQGARNSQGAALSAAKWVKRATEAKLMGRYYDRDRFGGIMLTPKGEEMATVWAKELSIVVALTSVTVRKVKP